MADYEIIETKYGEAVIKQIGDRWRVVFIDSGYTCFALKKDIDDGLVVDYLTPRVMQKGFGDYPQARITNFTQYVSIWKNMLREAYGSGGYTIDERWHDFRVFRNEFKTLPYAKRYVKDLKGTIEAENNHYSLSTIKIWVEKEAK